MVWVKLDDKFHSNPKVISVGHAGAGLYAMSLSYCGDHMTDGFVPDAWAAQQPKPLRDKLLKAGLWKKAKSGYTIPDFTTMNPTRAEVEAKREAQREGGRRGAVKRWSDREQHPHAHEQGKHGSTQRITHRSPHQGTHDDSHGPDPNPTSKDLPPPPTPSSQKPSAARTPTAQKHGPLVCRFCHTTKRNEHELREHLTHAHWPDLEPGEGLDE